jgi:hypothetical protein
MDEKTARKKKNTNFRNSFQKAADRAECIELLKKGYTYTQIARDLSEKRPYTISAQQITYDMQYVHVESMAKSTENYAILLDEEIRRQERIIEQVEEALIAEAQLLETTESGSNDKGGYEKVVTKYHNVVKPIPALLSVKATALARISHLRGCDSYLKFMDLNCAISALIQAGFEITAPSGSDLDRAYPTN